MNFAEFKKDFDQRAFVTYRVRMTLDKLTGGVPADPKMIDGWIASTNKALSDEQRKALVDATQAELPALSEDVEARAWVRFKQDEIGAYYEGRCAKAALKEAANIIKNLVKTRGKNGEESGTKALKSKVAECVFVVEDKIYILDASGEIVKGELPTEERPVHVMTMQGPRTSIKRADVIHGAHLEFTVKLAKTGAVSEEALFSALAYLQELGFGSDRSQGSGRTVEMDVVKLGE